MFLTQQPQIKLAKKLVRKAAPAPSPASAHHAPACSCGPDTCKWSPVMADLELCLQGCTGSPGLGTGFLYVNSPACRWCIRGPVILDSSAPHMSVQNFLLCCRNNNGATFSKDLPWEGGKNVRSDPVFWKGRGSLSQAQSL